ncbi:MAG: GC-type dockerin domain-anchored protein [Planctomycetota bacterium]
MKNEMICGAAAIAAVCGLAAAVSAGTAPAVTTDSSQLGDPVALVPTIEKRIVEVNQDSGPITVDGPQLGDAERVLAYSTEVAAPGSEWVRLEFGAVDLPGNLDDGSAAYIVITSATDGHFQILDSRSIGEWASTSAYFNGDSVFVDVYVMPGSAPARVEVTNVRGSIPSAAALSPDRPVVDGVATPESQCGPWDERTPNVDLRTARMQPIGCTGWTFNNRPNAMGSAGHCNPRSGDVMAFNPPLSTSSGAWQFPPPSMQYAVDGGSVRRTNGGVGNDWSIYGVFNNSTTGLNVMDAMLDSQPTVTGNAPAVNGQGIRITGFGSNSTPDPVPNEWDLAQKTHVGPYVQNSGTALRYAPDTSGGNSGSPVVDDSTGRIIGVHTHAGCSTSGGSNQGTSINNNNFRAALSGSQGIAQGIGPGVMWTIDGAASRPDRIGPDGTESVVVGLDADFTGAAPQAGSIRMMFDGGDGFVEIEPSASFGGVFNEFQFGAAACDTTARYYFTALDASGSQFSWPLGAPQVAFEVPVTGNDVLFSFDGNSNAGWSVNGNNTAGDWENGVPANAGKGAPWIDADGSGGAWMTGEGSVTDDVDGGETRLASPTMDITGATEPVLAFSYFHYASGNQDQFEVQVNDGGGWTTAFTANNSQGWTDVELAIDDFVNVNSQFRVRFISEDLGGSSVVESAVDAVQVVDRVCQAASQSCNPADLAVPFGFLDLSDVDAFITAFGNGDMSADFAAPFGVIDLSDVDAFIPLFAAGCP